MHYGEFTMQVPEIVYVIVGAILIAMSVEYVPKWGILIFIIILFGLLRTGVERGIIKEG